MRITAPMGDQITSNCPGHPVSYGGTYAADVGATGGTPVGTPVRFNGFGSPEGVIRFVSDAGLACASPTT